MRGAGLGGGDAAHMALVARERAYRQAIAALYWRAGEHLMHRDRARARAGAETYGALALTHMRYSLEQHVCGMAIWGAARALEDAL